MNGYTDAMLKRPLAVAPDSRTLPPSAADAARRASETLDRLDALMAELIAEDREYQPVERDFALPEGFKLSVVMPVYNEEATIRPIVTRVLRMPAPLELIIVDDGSRDGTRAALHELAELPNVTVLLKPQNEGKGAALRTGFQHATGDVVVVQDADLEYDPADLLGVIEPLVTGEADVVYGSRFLNGETARNSSLLHRLGNRTLTIASNLLTGYRLTDMETCYKAFRTEVIRDLPLRQDRFGFEPEVTAKLARRGRRIVERPIRYNARDFGEGKKIGVRDGLNALWCILRYRWAD